ncbi:hypothetical protein TrRE_jg1366, partial [Triparma retinervis]
AIVVQAPSGIALRVTLAVAEPVQLAVGLASSQRVVAGVGIFIAHLRAVVPNAGCNAVD